MSRHSAFSILAGAGAEQTLEPNWLSVEDLESGTDGRLRHFLPQRLRNEQNVNISAFEAKNMRSTASEAEVLK